MILVVIRESPNYPNDWLVETSVDDGPWKLQGTFAYTVGDDPISARENAERWARAFISGMQFAGAEVRATCGGYSFV